jgi:hypothetical protein
MRQAKIDEVESLRAAIAAGARPTPHGEGWECRQARVEPGWPAPFVINGQRYQTAEHYMMAEKAHLFGDEACRG